LFDLQAVQVGGKKMNKKRAERLENLPQVPAENGKIISDLRRRNY